MAQFKRLRPSTSALDRERRAKVMVFSILLFYVMPALAETHEIGRILLILNLYVALVSIILELKEKRVIFWSAVPIAIVSMVLLPVSHFHPTPAWLFANALTLVIFFSLASVSLFVYMNDAGQTDTGRIYTSVGLYFMLGLIWFAIYDVLSLAQPGSFTEGGTPLPGHVPRSTLIYFSLVTLTTLGYGDILPRTPPARIFAALEAAFGVLYVAITIARFVSARQSGEAKG